MRRRVCARTSVPSDARPAKLDHIIGQMATTSEKKPRSAQLGSLSAASANDSQNGTIRIACVCVCGQFADHINARRRTHTKKNPPIPPAIFHSPFKWKTCAHGHDDDSEASSASAPHRRCRGWSAYIMKSLRQRKLPVRMHDGSDGLHGAECVCVYVYDELRQSVRFQ